MHFFLSAARTGGVAEGRCPGRLVDERLADAQELIRLKLAHLQLVAVIALLLNRILRAVTGRMMRMTEGHAADAGPGQRRQQRTTQP